MYPQHKSKASVSCNITFGFFAFSSERQICVLYVKDFHQMGQTAGSKHDLLLTGLIYLSQCLFYRFCRNCKARQIYLYAHFIYVGN